MNKNENNENENEDELYNVAQNTCPHQEEEIQASGAKDLIERRLRSNAALETGSWWWTHDATTVGTIKVEYPKDTIPTKIKITAYERAKLKPYEYSDIAAELLVGPIRTVIDLIHKAQRYQVKNTQQLSAQMWATAIRAAVDPANEADFKWKSKRVASLVRRASIRMAKTGTHAFLSYKEENGGYRASLVVLFWDSAQKILAGLCEVEASRAITREPQGGQSIVQAQNESFISERRRKSTVSFLISEGDRNHVKFFQAVLPPITSTGNYVDKEVEFVANMVNLLEVIFRLDPKAVFLPWFNEHRKPSMDNSCDVSSKTVKFFQNYTDRISIRRNSKCYCRFKIAFNVKPNEWRSESLTADLENLDTVLTICAIQDKEISQAGWLLGSSTLAMNHPDLQDSLKLTSELEGMEVECRSHRVKYLRNMAVKDIPSNEQAMATHIYCAKSQVRLVRKGLKKVYRRDNKEGYPLGKKHSFIPSLCDPRLLTTPEVERQISKAAKIQRKLQESSIRKSTDRLKNLDVAVNLPDAGARTLREIMMCLRLERDSDKALLVSVDNSTQVPGEIDYVFDKKMPGVEKVVQLLPIILKGEFGSATSIWIKSDADDAYCEGWYFDKDTGTVKASLSGLHIQDFNADLPLRFNSSLPLHITFDRSDMKGEQQVHAATALKCDDPCISSADKKIEKEKMADYKQANGQLQEQADMVVWFALDGNYSSTLGKVIPTFRHFTKEIRASKEATPLFVNTESTTTNKHSHAFMDDSMIQHKLNQMLTTGTGRM